MMRSDDSTTRSVRDTTLDGPPGSKAAPEHCVTSSATSMRLSSNSLSLSYRIAQRVTHRPCLFLFCFAALLGVIFLVGSLTSLPISVESDFEQYLLTDGKQSKRWRQLTAASREGDEVFAQSEGLSLPPSRRSLLSVRPDGSLSSKGGSAFPDMYEGHLHLLYTLKGERAMVDEESSSKNILASPATINAIARFEAELIALIRRETELCLTVEEADESYSKLAPNMDAISRERVIQRQAPGCVGRRSIVPYFFSDAKSSQDIPPGARYAFLLFDALDSLHPLPSSKEQVKSEKALRADELLGRLEGDNPTRGWEEVNAYWKQEGVTWFCDNTYAPQSTSNPHCRAVRSEIVVRAKSAEAFKTFARRTLEPYLADTSRGRGESQVQKYLEKLIDLHYYGADGITEAEIQRIVRRDVAFALGSLAFVALYICFHTGSIVLGISGIVATCLAFPLAYFVFHWTGPPTMMVLNFLGCFVLIAVGADDLFVLSDLWKQAKLQTSNLTERYLLTVRKGGRIIIATSLTTGISFFANMASSIGPVRQFGLFMGLCVIAVCFIVLTAFPLVLVWNVQRSKSTQNACISFPRMRTRFARFVENETSSSTGRELFSARKIDHFFTTRYLDFLSRFRLPLAIAGCVIFLIAAIMAGVGFRSASGVPQFFPNGNNVHEVSEWREQMTRKGLDKNFAQLAPIEGRGSVPFSIQMGSLSTVSRGATVLVCRDGWTGRNCDRETFHCDAVPKGETACRNNGECVGHSGKCRCLEGWTGEDCGGRTPWYSFTPASPASLSPEEDARRRTGLCHGSDYFACGATDGTGVCFRGVCACTNPKWTGPRCDTPRERMEEAEANELPTHQVRPIRSFALVEGLSSNMSRPPYQFTVRMALTRDDTAKRSTEKSTSGVSAQRDDSRAYLDATARAVEGIPPTFSLGTVHDEIRSYFALSKTDETQSNCSVAIGLDLSSSELSKGIVAVLARFVMPNEESARGALRVVKNSPALSQSQPEDALRYSSGLYVLHSVTVIHEPSEASVRGYAPLKNDVETSDRDGPRTNFDVFSNSIVPEPAHVQIVWGIDGLERRGAFGDDKATYETSLELSSHSSQNAMLDICGLLPRPSEALAATSDEAALKRSLEVADLSCFIIPFKAWAISRGEGFPVAPGRFDRLVSDFSRVAPSWREDFGFDKSGRLQWTRATFRTNVSLSTDFEAAVKMAERWDQYVTLKARHYAIEVRHAIYPTSLLFVRAETQRLLVSSTTVIYLISALSALVAVFVFTRSLSLSVILMTCVISIVTCLLAAMLAVLRWKFGVLEAITVIIYIGLSVDYGLHFLLAFQQSPSSWSAKHRVQAALGQSGASILGAAVTTIGGCTFLFFCTIQVFVRFGGIIFLSTFFSLVYSLCFLPAWILMLAPSGKRFSVRALLRCQWKNLWVEDDPAKWALRDITLPSSLNEVHVVPLKAAELGRSHCHAKRGDRGDSAEETHKEGGESVRPTTADSVSSATTTVIEMSDGSITAAHLTDCPSTDDFHYLEHQNIANKSSREESRNSQEFHALPPPQRLSPEMPSTDTQSYGKASESASESSSSSLQPKVV